MVDSEPRLFFLLQRAAHTLRLAADRRCLAAAGITTAQLGALFAVQEAPGLTQRELARVLGLRESAVTGLVRRVVESGLVLRRPHPSEHRAVVLELTEEGADALRAARPEIDRFNAELHAVLGEDLDATARAMKALADWEPDD
jgi:DNA-binding MarR family transcriptional regulator